MGALNQKVPVSLDFFPSEDGSKLVIVLQSTAPLSLLNVKAIVCQFVDNKLREMNKPKIEIVPSIVNPAN